MPKPGVFSFEGQAVPAYGESEIRQSSDAQEDILTVVGCSTPTGHQLVCRTYASRASVSSATEVFKISTGGLLSQYKINVSAISTASSAVTVYASQTGAFLVDPGFSSGATVTLPKPAAGLFYSVYIGGKSASSQTAVVMGTSGTLSYGSDSAADGFTFGKTSALTVGAQAWFFSNGTKWYATYMSGYSSITPNSDAGATRPQMIS